MFVNYYLCFLFYGLYIDMRIGGRLGGETLLGSTLLLSEMQKKTWERRTFD